jgi:hypothetical protein
MCWGKETKIITEHFKDTQIKVALRTKNMIQNLIKLYLQTDKYEKSGIYQMPTKYIGQMGQTFQTRYREHTQAIRNNYGNSGYSSHILNTGHTYGSITDTMKVVKVEKGKHLNTLEKFHIYKISKGLQMDDTHIDTFNQIFEAIQE